jgi:hypothetical protein
MQVPRVEVDEEHAIAGADEDVGNAAAAHVTEDGERDGVEPSPRLRVRVVSLVHEVVPGTFATVFARDVDGPVAPVPADERSVL